MVRLLVVEGDAKMAKLLSRGLAEEGHAVDLADQGDDALRMAEEAGYDVIVLDAVLPGGLDGLNVCRELREREVLAPVLLLTLGDAIDPFSSARADDYLVKPFLFADLLVRLRALAALRSAASRH